MQTLREHGLSQAQPRHRQAQRRAAWSRSGATPRPVFSAPLRDLHQAWDEVSWRIAALRDNPACADAEHAAAGARRRPGPARAPDASTRPRTSPRRSSRPARPKVAILREQGVNSHVEMSYAMAQAGFDTFDVHMSDLQAGRARLDMFQGFVACGGFSYGDTLGAGEGWARSILFNPALAEQFAAFFDRTDTFALGVCNGCQMMAALAPHHPRRRRPGRKFTRNRSEQFEARLSLVEVLDEPVDLLRRHGRQPPADRGRARRGLRRLLAARRCRGGAARDALRRPRRRGRPRPTRPTRTAAPTA